MNGEDLLLKAEETLSSLLLCWEQPMVGEVLTALPVGQICEEAMHISPEKVSLPYSSRSTVLQSFFSLKMK
jgi:hypothetical protein